MFVVLYLNLEHTCALIRCNNGSLADEFD